jgi:hypothetical protein
MFGERRCHSAGGGCRDQFDVAGAGSRRRVLRTGPPPRRRRTDKHDHRLPHPTSRLHRRSPTSTTRRRRTRHHPAGHRRRPPLPAAIAWQTAPPSPGITPFSTGPPPPPAAPACPANAKNSSPLLATLCVRRHHRFSARRLGRGTHHHRQPPPPARLTTHTTVYFSSWASTPSPDPRPGRPADPTRRISYIRTTPAPPRPVPPDPPIEPFAPDRPRLCDGTGGRRAARRRRVTGCRRRRGGDRPSRSWSASGGCTGGCRCRPATTGSCGRLSGIADPADGTALAPLAVPGRGRDRVRASGPTPARCRRRLGNRWRRTFAALTDRPRQRARRSQRRRRAGRWSTPTRGARRHRHRSARTARGTGSARPVPDRGAARGMTDRRRQRSAAGSACVPALPTDGSVDLAALWFECLPAPPRALVADTTSPCGAAAGGRRSSPSAAARRVRLSTADIADGAEEFGSTGPGW